jgi:hypothetical protein
MDRRSSRFARVGRKSPIDEQLFDELTRRAAVGGLLAVSFLPFAGVVAAAAKKKRGNRRRRRKRPTLERNQYGCVNLGGKCRGKNTHCCSGRCQGKKPKKREPDASRCVDHDTGGCHAAQDQCATAFSPCGSDGFCYRTTGNASFCGAYDSQWFNPCTACTTDAECRPNFGPGAACIVCPDDCPPPGTACIPAAVLG